MKVTINQKERDIEGLKKVTYPRINAIDGDKIDDIDYAEYTIIGSNSEWVDWTPLDKFLKDNPGVI